MKTISILVLIQIISIFILQSLSLSNASAWHARRNALLRGNGDKYASKNEMVKNIEIGHDNNDNDDDNNNNEQDFEIKDIHLAFSDTIDTYIFSFTTGNKIDSPSVKLSINNKDNFFIPSVTTISSSRKNEQKLDNEMETLAQNEFYTFPPTYKSQYFHHLKINHLKPDTRYFYQVGDNSKNQKNQMWSEVYSFKTPPSSQGHNGNDNNFKVNVAIVGDLGQTKVSQKTLDLIKERKDRVNAIIIAGDLSYADCDQSRWESWFDFVQHHHISNSIPIMVAPGNHDVEGRHMCGNNDIKEEFLAYRRRFYMPTAQFAEFRNTYYSFEISQLAHFVILCPYCPYDLQSKQYKWFEEDLKKVNRKETPWLFVVTHEPFYCSNKAHYQEAEEMRKVYEPLFNRYHVNIVFSGHVHSYERTHAIYSGKVVIPTSTNEELQKKQEDGTVYITVGDGGNREGLAIGFFDDKPEWSAVRERKYGFGELEITPKYASWIWTCDEDPNYHDKVVLKL